MTLHSIAPEPLTLLYLSHLSWDHVWQRPQQLMTRFAQRCRVIYIDPPEVRPAPELHLEERPGVGGVRVLRPIFPAALLDTPGHSYEDLWLQLLPATLAQAGSNTMLWVSSPLADYLVAAARSRVRLAVYDCMDDLASFRGAPAIMRAREDHLLTLVDLLFTGGHSMYEARKTRHPRAYCFPSGVDVAHYAQTRDPTLAVPAALASVPSPRLGYFGVLDERIDWGLIGMVAARRPAWHWVLVGPTAKIAPEELPRAPNIHYLGQQVYSDLPAFLKGFAIATMPFALNEATRFISPTKTLEYLAGGKPVISTSVPDVVAGYREIVYLADGADAWIAMVAAVLRGAPEDQAQREARAATALAAAAWDNIADRMWQLISARLAAVTLITP